MAWGKLRKVETLIFHNGSKIYDIFLAPADKQGLKVNLIKISTGITVEAIST